MKRTHLLATILLSGIFVMASFSVQAQKYMTRNGHISFFSEAPLENIEAHNRQVNTAFDAGTGELVFRILMKSFEFEKALMQEHFNENYVESHKFPNATFTGKVSNLKEIDLTKNGVYNAVVEGDLTIHGVTRQVKENGTLEVNGDNLTGKCVFNIRLSDYNVTIPKAVANNIAETIEIRVDVAMRKL
jgi:polyisoprenoid-binding protein YceI